MADLDRFQKDLESLVRRAEKRAACEEERRRREKMEHERRLLRFDEFADRLQAEVIGPRVRHLASLFAHAFEPEMREEHEYRHRISVHFGHTATYPCTADVTFLVLHAGEAGTFEIEFEFLILPAYVTRRFKGVDEMRLPIEEASLAPVAGFVERNLRAFLESYLAVRRD